MFSEILNYLDQWVAVPPGKTILFWDSNECKYRLSDSEYAGKRNGFRAMLPHKSTRAPSDELGNQPRTGHAFGCSGGQFPRIEFELGDPGTGSRRVKALDDIPGVADEAGPRQAGYLRQRSSAPAAELVSLPETIAQNYPAKEFSAYELAALPDGTRYLVVFNEDKNLKFLNRNDSMLWYARLYRIGSENGATPELLREGLQSSGNDVTVPVELQLPGIGATKLKKLRTELGYSLNGYQNGKPQIYTGRGAVLQVSGSQIMPEGKLTLTINVPEEMIVTTDTQVSIRFEPMSPGLPEHTASGKASDFLTLGSARFVVTAIEQDFSSATLAVVAGSLAETLKQHLQLGTQMPAFSQVDLITRKTVTREDLLATSRRSAPTVFIFGDLAASGFRPPYGPPMGPGAGPVLPLPVAEASEQLGLELEPKPVVAFVTRQVGLDFLYGELRIKKPGYFDLCDFADPLRTTFRLPQMNPADGMALPILTLATRRSGNCLTFPSVLSQLPPLTRRARWFT